MAVILEKSQPGGIPRLKDLSRFVNVLRLLRYYVLLAQNDFITSFETFNASKGSSDSNDFNILSFWRYISNLQIYLTILQYMHGLLVQKITFNERFQPLVLLISSLFFKFS